MFYILITCNTKAAVEMILNKDLVWISKSLSSLELWNGQIIPPIRCTWLTCLGVPLNVWVAQTFRVNGKLIPIRVSEDSPTSVAWSMLFRFLSLQAWILKLGRLTLLSGCEDSDMDPEFDKPPIVVTDAEEVDNGEGSLNHIGQEDESFMADTVVGIEGGEIDDGVANLRHKRRNQGRKRKSIEPTFMSKY